MISGTEIAFFSLTPAQLNKIKTSTAKKDILIIRLLESPKRLLATILITNNFINVAIVIFSTYIATKLFNLTDFPVLAFVIQVIVITALILFIGEIMPKIYATQFSVRFAKIMAIPLQILIKIVYPLSSVLLRTTSVIDKRLSKRKHPISMNELSEAIDITSGEDVALLIKRESPQTKIIISTMFDSPHRVQNILKTIPHHGILIKSDSTSKIILEAFEIILQGNRFYSKTVQKIKNKITILKKDVKNIKTQTVEPNYSIKFIRNEIKKFTDRLHKAEIQNITKRKELPHEYYLRKSKKLLEKKNKMIDNNISVDEISKIEIELFESYENYKSILKKKKDKKKKKSKPKEKVFNGIQNINSILLIPKDRNRGKK